jgi:hypothetical protein
MGSAFELGRLIEKDIKSGDVDCNTRKPGYEGAAKLLDNKGKNFLYLYFNQQNFYFLIY